MPGASCNVRYSAGKEQNQNQVQVIYVMQVQKKLQDRVQVGGMLNK